MRQMRAFAKAADVPDAIIVLAGGLTEAGDVPPWVTGRLDAAARRHRETGAPILWWVDGAMNRSRNHFHARHESMRARMRCL